MKDIHWEQKHGGWIKKDKKKIKRRERWRKKRQRASNEEVVVLNHRSIVIIIRNYCGLYSTADSQRPFLKLWSSRRFM